MVDDLIRAIALLRGDDQRRLDAEDRVTVEIRVTRQKQMRYQRSMTIGADHEMNMCGPERMPSHQVEQAVPRGRRRESDS